MKTIFANLVFPLLILVIGAVFFVAGIPANTPLTVGLLEFGAAIMFVGFIISFVALVEEVAFYRGGNGRHRLTV